MGAPCLVGSLAGLVGGTIDAIYTDDEDFMALIKILPYNLIEKMQNKEQQETKNVREQVCARCRQKHPRTFCALSAWIARMYFQTCNRTVFSSTLNTPAIILSEEYVFSQHIAMRKWEMLGLAIRAASICVVCRSEKIALCVSGLAPK